MSIELNDIKYFALNLCDLTKLSPVELLLIQNKISSREIIKINKNIDGDAILLRSTIKDDYWGSRNQLIEDLLNYTKQLPKLHKDKMLHQKMDEMFTKGIDVRLLNKEEYISRLKAKVRRGYRMFLFDTIKPTTEEEIETHKDELWEA